MNESSKFYYLFFLFIIFALLTSCTTVSYETVYPTLKDGKYDSEFPYRGSSEELETISQSVKRINSTCFYKTYIFKESDGITLKNIQDRSLEDIAVETGFADQSSAGTGTIIYYWAGKVALLTCAHVVNYPDTVISFVADTDGNPTDFIETILVKSKQSVYVAGFPEGSNLEILAIDKKNDLALIGRNYYSTTNYIFPVLNYPLGKSKELEWGSFVYIFSYPMNFQMITKALVSSPNLDDKGSFILDAVINKGSSGGIVLAIKDGVPNFELVGIIQWAPGDANNIIAPEKRKGSETYNSILPYKGKLFVKRNLDIKYGIAKVIPVSAISDFIEQNSVALKKHGYYLEKFAE
ncbi:serine protease [bacterium BMS3Abin03]|jgi:hypothetical protein|nr:serine protease [bacterium BMS3Abin03]MCG6959129.1 serine protease [bacterium BMS3Abin03]